MDLKVVIKARDILYIRIGQTVKYRSVKLTCLAGASDDKPFPVFYKFGFRYTRVALEIIQITERNKPVKVLKPRFVLYKDYLMISWKTQGIGIHRHLGVKLRIASDAVLFHLFLHTEKYLCKHQRIIRGSVMMEILKPVVFLERIELVVLHVGIDEP